MKRNMKIHNHLYPAFHIRKWAASGGQIYDKTKGESREIKPQEDYSLKYYYSLGEKNSELEDRISIFEARIGELIKEIDQAEESIKLSGKEIELLKLYCILCGSRHQFTSEVITEDESGIYVSNNYLYGLHRAKNQKEAIDITKSIMDDFDKINALDDNIYTWIDYTLISPEFIYSTLTVGLHIAIARAENPIICISNRFCIIENTLDSDFLYSYVPISPTTAIFLVKSKYYLDKETFEYTKRRFGKKYGNGAPDSYLSVILGDLEGYDYEDKLFCSYSRMKSCVHIKEVYLPQQKTNNALIKINHLSKEVFRQYNAIFCEDGDKILYCDKAELDWALNNRIDGRRIYMSPQIY